MREDFIYEPSEFSHRPIEGYTFIYIYSIDNMYLYVGQTIQSIEKRFQAHFSDNSGAHYANNITYFQIRSRYANFAEGYIARRVNGICQCTIPNIDKQVISNDAHDTLKKIGNKLVDRKDKDEYLHTGNLPIFSFEIESDESNKNTLGFLNQILNVTLVTNHFRIRTRQESTATLYLNELAFKCNSGHMKGYVLSRPQIDFRPIVFLLAKNCRDIKEVIPLLSNFPIYCVLEETYYKQYKSKIDKLFKTAQIGLLMHKWNEIYIQYRFSEKARCIYKNKARKNNMSENIIPITDVLPLCTTTAYKAKLSAYNNYVCF